MWDRAQSLIAFARDALRAERLSNAGKVNLFGLFCLFLLIVGTGVFDLIQVIVRIWNDSYQTGLPSLVTLILVFGGLLLGCVAIVGLTDPGEGAGS